MFTVLFAIHSVNKWRSKTKGDWQSLAMHVASLTILLNHWQIYWTLLYWSRAEVLLPEAFLSFVDEGLTVQTVYYLEALKLWETRCSRMRTAFYPRKSLVFYSTTFIFMLSCSKVWGKWFISRQGRAGTASLGSSQLNDPRDFRLFLAPLIDWARINDFTANQHLLRQWCNRTRSCRVSMQWRNRTWSWQVGCEKLVILAYSNFAYHYECFE